MPDKRRHRGPHPADLDLFSATQAPNLRSAAHDLCWLLDRDYPDRAALKLVGDRFALRERQRIAVRRASCTAVQAERRAAHRVDDLAGHDLAIDGFNVLTTVESAMSGGLVLYGRDQTARDMASMHGTYRQVVETGPAIELTGRRLAKLGLAGVRWLLDSPVSNSGRLAGTIREIAARNNWPWTVELVPDPDPLLIASDAVVASADSAILDGCNAWFNLVPEVLADTPDAWSLALF